MHCVRVASFLVFVVSINALQHSQLSPRANGLRPRSAPAITSISLEQELPGHEPIQKRTSGQDDNLFTNQEGLKSGGSSRYSSPRTPPVHSDVRHMSREERAHQLQLAKQELYDLLNSMRYTEVQKQLEHPELRALWDEA